MSRPFNIYEARSRVKAHQDGNKQERVAESSIPVINAAIDEASKAGKWRCVVEVRDMSRIRDIYENQGYVINDDHNVDCAGPSCDCQKYHISWRDTKKLATPGWIEAMGCSW